MITPKIPVAKEGMPFIGLAVFTTLTFAILGYTVPALALLLTTLFITWFFRDPERMGPVREDCLLSPADGKIILIQKNGSNDLLEGESCKISVFMNVFNVHVNRAPCNGTVDTTVYTPGLFYSADSAKGDLKNERCAVFLTTEDGQKIAFVQVAGLIARRIICWLEPGDVVKRGQRFGLIRFGSRVDIHLPASIRVDVQVGDTVRAGETIIGSFEQQS